MVVFLNGPSCRVSQQSISVEKFNECKMLKLKMIDRSDKIKFELKIELSTYKLLNTLSLSYVFINYACLTCHKLAKKAISLLDSINLTHPQKFPLLLHITICYKTNRLQSFLN